MRTMIQLLPVLFILACFNSSENYNNEKDTVQLATLNQSSTTATYPSNPDEHSLDFESIKIQSVKTDALKSTEINKLPLKKASKEFIDKYLHNCKLPFTQEIDEVHQFEYHFLTYNQTDKYFSFTLLSKSATIQSATIYMFVADLKKGHLQDCAAIAEYFDYEGAVINFEATFNANDIVVQQAESIHNEDGNLETKKQKIVCTVNEGLKIAKNNGKKTTIIGKENAIFLEYDNLLKLTVPGFYFPHELSESNPMYRSSADLRGKDTISFEIWDFDGISGDLANNKLLFDINLDNITLNSVKLAVATGIFFNEDGSGGVWNEGGSELSDWFELEKISDYEYKIPDSKTLLKKAQINKDQLAAANKKVKNDARLSYNIYFSYQIIELDYTAYGKPNEKYIEFNLIYGD
jgi:hypothetical protein